MEDLLHLLHRPLLVHLLVYHGSILFPSDQELAHLVLIGRVEMQPELLLDHQVSKVTQLLRHFS